MKTASVHDLKNDLKMLSVNRFIGQGYELTVIFFTGTIFRVRVAIGKHVYLLLFLCLLHASQYGCIVYREDMLAS